MLRLGTALFVLSLLENATGAGMPLTVAAWFCAAALLFGVLTRLVAMLVVVCAVLVWQPAPDAASNLIAVGGVAAAALAFLGGGLWSVDAQLFGRRVIDLEE